MTREAQCTVCWYQGALPSGQATHTQRSFADLVNSRTEGALGWSRHVDNGDGPDSHH